MCAIGQRAEQSLNIYRHSLGVAKFVKFRCLKKSMAVSTRHLARRCPGNWQQQIAKTFLAMPFLGPLKIRIMNLKTTNIIEYVRQEDNGSALTAAADKRPRMRNAQASKEVSQDIKHAQKKTNKQQWPRQNVFAFTFWVHN